MHAWQSCDGGGEGPENKGAWQHDGRERPQERYCLTRLFETFLYLVSESKNRNFSLSSI